MANKSNPATQTISTPQGGGALHGIGETFSPDLHTGTGNFTVPIAMPPGRNGFQPQLSLVYSTGNGNGPYGLGWSLTHSWRESKDLKRNSSLSKRPWLTTAIPSSYREQRISSLSPKQLASLATDRERKDSSPGSNTMRPQRPIIGRSAARTAWSVCTERRSPCLTTQPPSPIRRIEPRSSVGTSRRPSIPSATPFSTSMNEIRATPPTITGISSI